MLIKDGSNSLTYICLKALGSPPSEGGKTYLVGPDRLKQSQIWIFHVFGHLLQIPVLSVSAEALYVCNSADLFRATFSVFTRPSTSVKPVTQNHFNSINATQGREISYYSMQYHAIKQFGNLAKHVGLRTPF